VRQLAEKRIWVLLIVLVLLVNSVFLGGFRIVESGAALCQRHTASVPVTLQQFFRNPFCAKYRCAERRDRTATRPKPGVTAWNVPLASNTLGLIAGSAAMISLRNGGGLISIGLNFENAIPGDGSTPTERATVYRQMRSLIAAFNQAFFPGVIPRPVLLHCDFETGLSPNFRFRVGSERYQVHCESFSYSIQRV
jgi:hypothetical protein